MQIQLKKRGSADVHSIEWDADKGTLSGDPAITGKIKKVCEFGMADGSLPITPTWSYPIKKPLHDPLELAVVLLFLDFSADELPLPEPELIESDVEVVY